MLCVYISLYISIYMYIYNTVAQTTCCSVGHTSLLARSIAILTYEEMMSLLAINYGLESKTVSILRILQNEEFYSSLT